MLRYTVSFDSWMRWMHSEIGLEIYTEQAEAYPALLIMLWRFGNRSVTGLL